MEPEDFEPFKRYLEELNDDPVRLGILAAGNFIEEMMELVIAETVPNSECFEVPKMRFVDKLQIIRKLYPDGEEIWRIIDALNKLRAAAAHRNYEQLRDERFTKLAEVAGDLMRKDPEASLRYVAAFCFGYLNAIREELLDTPG
jgi:hypothetical protein